MLLSRYRREEKQLFRENYGFSRKNFRNVKFKLNYTAQRHSERFNKHYAREARTPRFNIEFPSLVDGKLIRVKIFSFVLCLSNDNEENYVYTKI